MIITGINLGIIIHPGKAKKKKKIEMAFTMVSLILPIIFSGSEMFSIQYLYAFDLLTHGH